MTLAQWLVTINFASIGWIVGFSVGGVREAALNGIAVLVLMLGRHAVARSARPSVPWPSRRRRHLDDTITRNPNFLELVADWRELNASLPQEIRDDWRAFRSWARGRRPPDPGRLPPLEWPGDLGDLAPHRHYAWRRIDPIESDQLA